MTRFFGVQNLDLVEDVVQETLLKALQQWLFQGIPENPAGWILQSAKNRAIYMLRRQSTFRNKQTEIADKIEQDFNSSIEDPNVTLDHEFKDDQLKMMFVCCPPVISREARIALTLKTLCGFSVTEIARAFLSQESTIAQRLVRAKRKIRESDFPFELPDRPEITGRLDSVLDVLYLLFNEGYSAHQGEVLVRDDLCEEAIRLTCILAEHTVGDQPKVHALLALMFLQASRLPARVDCDGNLSVLKEQDRTLWDERLIRQGFYHLDRAACGDELSEYHLQAGIASCHAAAESYESTDWQRILAYYDELVNMNHSPVVALNRAVALSMVLGPEAGIEALENLKSLPPMKSYYLLPATYAEFFAQMGESKQALKFYRKALELVGTKPEKLFLLKKLKECENSKIAIPANAMK